jgi:hypothetical protein
MLGVVLSQVLFLLRVYYESIELALICHGFPLRPSQALQLLFLSHTVR